MDDELAEKLLELDFKTLPSNPHTRATYQCEWDKLQNWLTEQKRPLSPEPLFVYFDAYKKEQNLASSAIFRRASAISCHLQVTENQPLKTHSLKGNIDFLEFLRTSRRMKTVQRAS